MLRVDAGLRAGPGQVLPLEPSAELDRSPPDVDFDSDDRIPD